jgi:hypothetical protein
MARRVRGWNIHDWAGIMRNIFLHGNEAFKNDRKPQMRAMGKRGLVE